MIGSAISSDQVIYPRGQSSTPTTFLRDPGKSRFFSFNEYVKDFLLIVIKDMANNFVVKDKKTV